MTKRSPTVAGRVHCDSRRVVAGDVFMSQLAQREVWDTLSKSVRHKLFAKVWLVKTGVVMLAGIMLFLWLLPLVLRTQRYRY